MKTMRDVFISGICKRMEEDESIFFLSADFGSPRLDELRKKFNDRFINVGIAEQNLVNVSTGLALEGFTVYAYAIAPFLSMRAYEQIRINLALQSQLRDVNVNLVGVGAGMSYDVSGPTHHCFEDVTIMRTLPNMTVFSPSDWALAEKFVDYSIREKKPKYIRFEGKALPRIYGAVENVSLEDGFYEVKKGSDICLVATGYMTHKALEIASLLATENIDAGVVDVFMLKTLNETIFRSTVGEYRCAVTLEEGFINKGGLDALTASALEGTGIAHMRLGLSDKYMFEIGSREYLHGLFGIGTGEVVGKIKSILKEA